MTTAVAEEPAPTMAPKPSGLRRLRGVVASLRGPLGVAWALGLLQALILLVEEEAIWSRGELTIDYQVFARAYALIGPGWSLDPRTFVPGAGSIVGYMHNHFELITWPLAWLLVGLLRLPVHVVLLDLLQAIPTALVGPLAAIWANGVASERGVVGWRRWVVVVTPALLALLDVWLYWADSFDFHYQALQTALMLGVFLTIQRQRRWVATLLLGLLALTGDTAGLVIAGVGLVALWDGWRRRGSMRRWWGQGAAILMLAILTVEVPALLRDNLGTALAYTSYAQLLGVHATSVTTIVAAFVRHPQAVLARLYRRRWDVWSVLGGSGFLGLGWIGSIVMLITIGLPAWFGSPPFGYAGVFQLLPLVAALLLGSASSLASAARRPSPRGLGVLAIGGVLAAGAWLGVFAPALVTSLREVAQPDNGTSLRFLADHAPAGVEIATTNASFGAFAEAGERAQPVECPPWSMQVSGRPLEAVAEPWRGIQVCSPAALLSEVAGFQQLSGARSIGPLPGGVFAVTWDPGPYRGMLVVPPTVIPGQDLAGLSSLGLRTGPAVPESEGGGIGTPSGGGFVLEGLVGWVRPFHQGVALVNLELTGQVEVQVFDDATGQLLARRYLSGAGQAESLSVPFSVPRYVPPRSFTDGVGLIRTAFLPPLHEDPVELRVWVPPGSGSNAVVSSVWIGPTSEAPRS